MISDFKHDHDIVENLIVPNVNRQVKRGVALFMITLLQSLQRFRDPIVVSCSDEFANFLCFSVSEGIVELFHRFFTLDHNLALPLSFK